MATINPGDPLLRGHYFRALWGELFGNGWRSGRRRGGVGGRWVLHRPRMASKLKGPEARGRLGLTPKNQMDILWLDVRKIRPAPLISRSEIEKRSPTCWFEASACLGHDRRHVRALVLWKIRSSPRPRQVSSRKLYDRTLTR